MIEIKEVRTRKEIKDFINFPLKLYKNSKYYIPEFRVDQKELFSKKCIYLDQVKQIFFLAYENKKVVGRIQGIIQLASNSKWNQKRVRFTRIDFYDNYEISEALINAVINWAKDFGINEIVGPLGYNDLEREGLLIEGFNEESTFEETYNYEYYQKHLERLGFIKDVDWVESKLYYKEENKDHLQRLSDIVMKRYKLKILTEKTTTRFLNKYGDKFFDILDETYKDIYGTVPFTENVKKKTISSFKLILNLKYCALIADQDDNVVCFGLCFPNISEAVRKSKGRFTPLSIIRLLYSINHPKIIDLGLVGVKDEYKMKGVNGIILNETMKILSNKNIKYAETNLNLENNTQVLSQWDRFNTIQNKRRRSYIKKF